MNKSPMTVPGAQQLRDELHRLKSKERPGIIQALAEARAHGDLRENAEYHAAREQQSLCEGRIAEIEDKLSNAEIIDVATVAHDGRVVFGTTVVLLNIESNAEMIYQIVGEDEADIKASRVSINSPVARALIGKEEGDTTTVDAPGGSTEYEIVEVRYE